MKPILSSLAVVATLASLSTSCNTGGNVFIVITREIPAVGTPDPTDKTKPLAGSCVYAVDTPEFFYPTFSPTTGLTYGVVLDNRLNSAGKTANAFNSNDFTAESTTVSFESTDGTAVNAGTVSGVAEGFVAASGISVVRAVIIDSKAAALLPTGKYVRVHIHVTGRLGDGSTVNTSDFSFITISGTGDECIVPAG